ncbi:hypothetical protein [Dickeya poaceiphila]|uniref:Uncharacterized protein n=1 Tax=Dickeya poaceiphila TaxID=568768 RepID=A0A5B8HP98_9GAMM|nr:hypothetical protein [Dickeya poaceiphila]QDX30965.1 hypothetical protein Dpoa569_0002918 [Dickeya poaceiphila]
MKVSYLMEESVTVRNEKGSSRKTDPNCKTWIKHWENYSGKKANSCSIKGCKETDDLVGAHVLRPYAKNEDYKKHPYIIPMCDTHNGKSHEEEQTTKPNTTFVWANVSETCGE